MTTRIDRPPLEQGLAMPARHSGKARAAWHWLREEIRKTRPVFLFFLIGFLVVLLIIKLSLAQYSIEMSALSKALVGAILAAKIVLILENTPLARPFRHSARVLEITSKTLVYGLGVMLLGYIERIFDAFRHSGNMVSSFDTVIETSNVHRLLAFSVGIAMVFAAYFCFAEIGEFMGKGALHRFFLQRRDIAGEL
ncbi:MAG TPA: hypothetical protein VJN94_15870 [Candidatus Binataceae bacterium]|nr:hypothetical protein [Candidatus Binataceae bacterium]